MPKVKSQEDFSFPTAIKMPASLSESPLMNSLCETKMRLNLGTRRSLSAGNLLDYARNSKLEDTGKENEAEEEKMDLLWENFNEELAIPRNHVTEAENKLSSSGSMKLSKANVLMFSSRRRGVVEVMKALRKIFLIHNYQHSIKKL